MTSTLSRLFAYAKTSQNDARENFTTEALAAAIRDDPAPMLTVLRKAGALRAAVTLVNVFTQKAVPTAGIVDLALVFSDSSEVWVEVKVDAGESGDQLNNYLAYLARDFPDGKLVTLAKYRLRGDVDALTWQDLRRAIAGKASPYWRDFRTYLEEIHMADAYDEPLSNAELTALDSGHSLFRKVARILVPVAENARSVAPALAWPSDEDDVLRMGGRQFRAHGILGIFRRARLRAGVSRGALSDGGEARLGVWVWNNPKATDVRRQILARADETGLPAAWERDRVGWKGLGAYRRLTECADPKVAAAWLIEKLGELRQARILELLPVLGPAGDGEADADG